MHVLIATPMYGGNCTGVYANSVMGLTFALAQRGIKVSFSHIYNESLITRARNNLVREFLKSSADVLLFIDADESFSPEDVVKMLEADLPVIGAVYPMKAINWDGVRRAALAGKKNLSDFSGIFAFNLLMGETTFNTSDSVEVSEVATGLMAIKREVFELLEPHCPKYALNGPDGRFDTENMVTEFFATSIQNGILLSEDYHFCNLYRSLGGKVYAAPWVRVDHVGTYVFNGRFVEEAVLNNLAKPKGSEPLSDTTSSRSE
jgi:glycosyltransferase involved in cell wall biosynthesis